MKIRLQLTDNPPTVTSQEKGETIKYKWIVRNGKRVSIPYIHHFEKPEVAKARSFYTGRILIEMKKNKLKPPRFEGPCQGKIIFGFKARRKKDIGKLKDTKPDCDNMNKLLQDVLADIGFFKVGDQQIGDLTVIKLWSEEPFIEIDIQEASEALNDIYSV